MNEGTIAHGLDLKAGELIEVRSKEEILRTLDRNGCLDGQPFMPEMFEFCGKRLRVYKRAHKTCDTINWSGSRRLAQTVHLEGIRCGGRAHGGCQADCLIFWKEAWLKRASADSGKPDRHLMHDDKLPAIPVCTEAAVNAAASKTRDGTAGEATYVCQATQLLESSSPMARQDLRQYWEDYTSGNVSPAQILAGFAYVTYNRLIKVRGIGKWIRRLYDKTQQLRGKPPHPRTRGVIPTGAPTPSAKLNLQPGELVRVKSFNEILKTIDEDYRNRGMKWDAEMVPYCGGTYRVRKRVQQLIDEKTGKMLQLKSDAIILEGVICQSRYSDCRYFCPRSIYSYWREIWLERVDGKSVGNVTIEDRDNSSSAGAAGIAPAGGF